MNRTIRCSMGWKMSNEVNYELVAKNNFVVGQVLTAVVALTRIFEPSLTVLQGLLFLLAMAFTTVSTYAWMSR